MMAEGMSWQEAAGFGERVRDAVLPDRLPARLEPEEEVLDGEAIPPPGDFNWQQWYEPDKDVTVFKLTIDQTWYRRVDRGAWEELNAALLEIQRLGRL